MSEDHPGLIQNPDTAHIEANISKEEITPKVKRDVVGTAENNSGLKALISPLNDTGYLELGSQRLDQLRQEYPAFYNALTSRQDAIARLANTLVPGYTPGIWDSYMAPEEAMSKAASAPLKDQVTADKRATETAVATINAIAVDVNSRRWDSKGLPIETSIQTLRRVNNAVLDEISNSNIPLDSRRIGALTEGVLATLKVIEEEPKVNPRFGLDIGQAISKQAGFDKAAS